MATNVKSIELSDSGKVSVSLARMIFIFGAVLAGILVVPQVLAAQTLDGQILKTSPSDEPLEMEQVAPGHYVHYGVHEDASPTNHGDIANIGFIVGEKAVAVIDTGGSFNLGRRLRQAIRAVTDLPIAYVVNTHVHPDHIFGNAAFLETAPENSPEFIGHEKLGPAMAQKASFYLRGLEENLGKEALAGTAVVPPTHLVKRGEVYRVDLGGRVLEMTAHSTAHTNNDLSVLDTSTRTLWSGDLLFIDRLPSLDGSLLGWRKVLGEIKTWNADLVIPGHGVVAPWPQAAQRELDYFNVLLKDIRPIIERGGTIEEAVKSAGKEEKDKWVLFEDYNPRNVTAAFVELEWE